MSTLGDNAVIVIKERLWKGMSNLGQEVVDYIQASISQRYPPASQPGESPHTRTGELWKGIDHNQIDDALVIIERISSVRTGSIDIPMELEFDLNRPYMRPGRYWTQDNAAEILKRELK